METRDIEEAWTTLTNQDTTPREFLEIVNTFRKRKSVFSPQLFTLDDFAICTMFYDMTQMLRKPKQGKE